MHRFARSYPCVERELACLNHYAGNYEFNNRKVPCFKAIFEQMAL